MFQYIAKHLDTVIGWVVTLLASWVAAMIPLLHHSRKYKIRKAEKEAMGQKLQREQLLLEYARKALPTSGIAEIQILRMAHPHRLEDLYVPLRVQAEATAQSLLNARMRKAEETHDPDLYLQAELDLLEYDARATLDPVEAIRTYKQIVIVGDPGSGKTTLLRHLALQSAKQQLKDLPSLPFYVELSRFDARKQQDLLDLFVTRLGDFITVPDAVAMKELITEKMRAGQVILLLDGLDETRLGVDPEEARQAYAFLLNEIKRLANLYKSMPVLVAVRKAHYQHSSKLEGFHEVEVAGFRPEDSQTFVEHWYQDSRTTNRAEKIHDLQSRLRESLRVRTLVSNPLLLTMAAIVYERYLELPESRAEFYRLCIRECIEVLQTEWDARRDIKRPNLLSSRSQLLLLQEIAWHFHTCGIYPFPLEELLQVIENFLPHVDVTDMTPDRAQLVLEQIASANGLLCEQAPGMYGFSHLTFQEYFAAQYLNVHRNEADLLKHLHSPWWEQVVLFYANMHDGSWLLGILLGHEPEHFKPDTVFYTHLLLAGRCLAERQQLVRRSALREEVVDKLFNLLLTTPYALLRERAATTLAMIGGPSINNNLLNLLEKQDRVVRECVCDALGVSGERQLAAELTELLLRESERSMRIVIIRALGRLGNIAVVPALLSILEDPQEDAYVQQRIALTLAEFRERKIVDTFLRLLAIPTTNPMVQRGMIIALGVLGDRPVARMLLEILYEDTRDSLVRTAAAKALGRLGQAEFASDLSVLLENHRDTVYVRQHVAAALGVLRPAEQATACLLPALEKPFLDVEVKCSIAEALRTSGNRELAHRLLRLLLQKHLGLRVRASIILTLGYLGNDSASVLDALQRLSRTPEIELRAAVLAARGMLGVRTVRDKLVQELKASVLTQDMLLHMLHALDCLSCHHAIDKSSIARELAHLLSSQQIDRYVKEHIVALLRHVGEPTVSGLLFDLLEDQAVDRALRQHIAEFIGETAENGADAARLNELLKSTDIIDDVFHAYWTVDRRLRGKNS